MYQSMNGFAAGGGRPAAKAAYLDASVATASPARLLVMLYERLVLDVRRALDAQQAGDNQEAHNQLVHAQEIVIELRSSLRTELWDGGPGLASIYDFLHTELIKANVAKDAAIIANCLTLVTDLCDAWRQAALQSLAAE